MGAAELRRDSIHAHGIALHALGLVAASLIAAEPKRWKERLKPEGSGRIYHPKDEQPRITWRLDRRRITQEVDRVSPWRNRQPF